MNVSIIMPTYNRGEKLLSALRSLEPQSYKDFQVIIVNDGSTDNTKEILDTRLKELNLNIKVIHQENSGRARVRNKGAKEALDGLLIFMDDDMRHDVHAIEMHVRHHLKEVRSILVGNQIEELELAKTDIQKYRASLSKKWSDDLARSEGPLNKSNLHITAANFSIPKTIFLELNGFDQNLTDTEDYDLAMRAYTAGIPIYYNNNIIGWHDDFITCKSYVARRKQYLRSHIRLQILKPELYSRFRREPHRPPRFLRKAFYKIFKGGVWINLVDSELFTILPRQLRYRLYNVIIYANSFS